MTDPLSYQPFLDQLIARSSSDGAKAALVEAKAEYFERTGEDFEDDSFFEARMASFLDYFLFDRPSKVTGKTPAQELYEEKALLAPDSAALFRAFTETIHG